MESSGWQQASLPAVKPGLRPGGPGVAVPAAWDALRFPGGKMPPFTATRMVAATGREGCRYGGSGRLPAGREAGPPARRQGVAVPAAWDALQFPDGQMPPFTATRMVAATAVAAGFQPAVKPGLRPGGRAWLCPRHETRCSFRAAGCRPPRQPRWLPLP